MNTQIRNFFLGSFLILLIGVLFSASSAEAVGKRLGPKATLTLVKTVINDNSGTKQIEDFTLQIDGQTIQNGVPQILTVGAHIASEVPMPGYSASVWGGDCAPDGTITLQRKQNAICTITNDDIESSILQENFNSYLDGSIIGQDDWFDRENGTPWIIQNSIVQEGLKALSNFNPSGESIITKNTGTALADGRQSFYIRPENRSNWSSYHIPNFQLGMFQGSWDGPSRITVGFGIDGQVSYINADTDTRANFGAYNDNAWNLLDIEWRSSDKTARYKLNNGLWTDWIPFTGGAAFTGFDTVGLNGANLGSGGVYIDNLH